MRLKNLVNRARTLPQKTNKVRCYTLVLALLLVWFPACKKSTVEELSSPAKKGSGQAYLASGNDRLYMTWLEKESNGSHSLKGASWKASDGWSSPFVIVAGAPFFVNWADFPSIAILSKSALVAHWLQKSEGGKYAYDVMFSRSNDGGQSWSEPERLHSDRSPVEHGFATLIPTDTPEQISAVWLDGRNMKGDPHDPSNQMALMYSINGREEQLDPRVCDCCQTDATRVPDGVVVVYRDRTEQEVRDIFYMRFSNGAWSEPRDLSQDSWQIDACPVNGPAIASNGNRVVTAWFTGAQNQPRVQVVFSADGGKSFGKAIRIDGGNPSGRVDAQILHDGSAVVSWLENKADKGAEIRMRRVYPDGKAEDPLVVADSSSARASGFPRMMRIGEDIIVAWTSITDSGKADDSQVRIVRVRVS